MITKTDLIEAIKRSTRTMDVCVPSRDYYSHDDWQTENISFIDADSLIQELENIK